MNNTEDLIISYINDINAHLDSIINAMPHRLITPLNYDQIDKLYTATYSLQQKLEQQLKQLNQSTWALQCATLNEQYKSALAGIHNKKVKYLIDELEYSELQAKTQHVDSGPY